MRDLALLIIEDNDALRELMVLYLRRKGYDVREAPSAEHAQVLLGGVDVVISDIDLPGETGLDFAARSGVPTIFMSGSSSGAWRVRRRFPGAVFLPKPFRLEEIVDHLRAFQGTPLSIAS